MVYLWALTRPRRLRRCGKQRSTEMNAHQIEAADRPGPSPVALLPQTIPAKQKPRKAGQGTIYPRLAEPARAAQRRRHARPDARSATLACTGRMSGGADCRRGREHRQREGVLVGEGTPASHADRHRVRTKHCQLARPALVLPTARDQERRARRRAREGAMGQRLR